MDIRTYCESDESGVIALWQACGLVVPWNDPARDIARKLRVGRDLFLVGERSGLITGTVMGGYDGHRGWVNYLAVAPDCRRLGDGRRLVEAVERRLRARGCPKLNLQVRSSNLAVIAFYHALGFTDDDVVSLGKRFVDDRHDPASPG